MRSKDPLLSSFVFKSLLTHLGLGAACPSFSSFRVFVFEVGFFGLVLVATFFYPLFHSIGGKDKVKNNLSAHLLAACAIRGKNAEPHPVFKGPIGIRPEWSANHLKIHMVEPRGKERTDHKISVVLTGGRTQKGKRSKDKTTRKGRINKKAK